MLPMTNPSQLNIQQEQAARRLSDAAHRSPPVRQGAELCP